MLIPRNETELTAEQAIYLISKNGYKTAIDICTGSGCIAVSIAAETGLTVHACDISEEALVLAKRNAKRNGVAEKTNFFVSDMFESVSGMYDIIVCNPPYISDNEYEELEKSVKEYEPKLALAAGDGLSFYRNIAVKSMRYLNSGGALVLEIGASQAKSVIKMLKQNGLFQIGRASWRERVFRDV